MTRLILIAIVIALVSHVLWRIAGGILEGLAAGPTHARVLQRGVRMVRDPVCGTFVLPDRAVTMVDQGRAVHFCSDACRDRYGRKQHDP
jgi:YHS domain-containing protein